MMSDEVYKQADDERAKNTALNEWGRRDLCFGESLLGTIYTY